MSIDLQWDALTKGPDSDALAESVRDFINDRFQKVTLPKFIRSVKVHSFDFGSVAPELEIKDVCDPLPDFYEDSSDDGDEDDDDAPRNEADAAQSEVASGHAAQPGKADAQRTVRLPEGYSIPAHIDTNVAQHRNVGGSQDHPSPVLSRSSTPGIPGGTSNLSYFHLPLSAGLSGSATPFGAIGGPHFNNSRSRSPTFFRSSLSERNSQLNSPILPNHAPPWDNPPHIPLPHQNLPNPGISPIQEGVASLPTNRPPLTSAASHQSQDKSVNDVQLVCHLKYTGDTHMSLTADILLDYPINSFVGIPMKLKVTGLKFNGVALLAYISGKVHFCFLAPDDADALIGHGKDLGDATSPREEEPPEEEKAQQAGGLLEEIYVESEIGEKGSGKQVLKNVGKVEKFILEQVRRIFETEFVYPSFWTFLV